MNKHSKKYIGLSAALLVLVLLLMGCQRDNADAQCKEILQSIEKNEAAAAWKVASKESRALFPKEDMAGRMAEAKTLLKTEAVDITKVKLNKEKSSSEERIYDAMFTLTSKYGEIKHPTTLHFVKEGEGENPWRIDWSPALIWPELNKDNSIVVDTVSSKRGAIYDRHGELLAEDKDGVRQYPYGKMMAPALGFVRGVTEAELVKGVYKNIPVGTPVGRAGLEEAYNKQLAGSNGQVIHVSDSKSKKPLFATEAKDGKDIHTTLDLRVCQAAYGEISGHYGAVTAIDPNTGQVLAMLDGSSYDPSKWLDQQMNEADYQTAVEEGTAPLLGDYASVFTPGSTQKLFTSLIGLNSGVMTWDTYYQIYGEDWQPDTSWGGYRVHRVTPINGPMGLKQALISSDNIFFSMLALNIGAEKFQEGLKHLGYTQKVPGALRVMPSHITANGKDIAADYQTALADTSYGQFQIQISPLQMALTYGLLANNNIMTPRYLLDEQSKPWIADVTSADHLKGLNDALRLATSITHPSGDRSYAAFVGKTGTAEVGPDGSVNLGWYCGYDRNNPNLTMCVMVNGVENSGGSDYNTAMFGRIMDVLYANGPFVIDPTAANEKAS